MKITEFSVKRYQFTLVAFLAIVALGIYSLLNISRSEDPVFPIAMNIVTVVYPGASPIDMEKLVGDPIEKSVNELDDIKSIKTINEDGLTIMTVEFIAGSDPDKKYDEVIRQVNNVRGELPKDLAYLEVDRINTLDVYMSQVALSSTTANFAELDDIAKDLKKRFESVAGVRKVEIKASPKRQAVVQLRLDKLSQVGIPVNQVLGLIEATNVNIPGGSIQSGRKQFNIKTSTNYASLEELGNVVIGAQGGSILHLKDVAELSWEPEEDGYFGRFNGKNAVFLVSNMKKNVNIFSVQEGINAEIESFSKTLPKGVTIDKGFQQAANVEHRLNGLVRDFIIAILLVLLTLLPLGTRASIIVMISIPLSLLMGIFALDMFGFNINQLSIVGLVIALGLVVDDSIVVVENISRFLREGYSPDDAALAATQQIGVAVMGTTATLIFAFLPLLMLPGTSGDYIRSLPMAVVTTVVASLIVSLTIIPFLAGRFMKPEDDPEGNRFMKGLHKIIDMSFAKLLHKSLEKPIRTLIITGVIFVGSLALIPVVGFSLFPKAGIPQFLVTVETPEGSNITATDSAVAFVEGVLQEQKEVEFMFSNIGKGNPEIYYNMVGTGQKASLGEVFVQIERMHSDGYSEFYERLRERFKKYPHATIKVKEFENGPPIDAPIAMRILGEDLDELRVISAQVEDIMKNTEGTLYINNPMRANKTEVSFKLNREKASMLGVTEAEFAKTIRLAIAGLELSTIRNNNGDEYNILVTLPKNRKQTIDVFDKLTVASLSGALIPVKQVADMSFESSPTKINHYNKERAVTVTSFVKDGYNTDKLTKEVIEKVNQIELPSGYRINPAGELESRQESFGGLGIAIIIAVFGIIGILILEFGSFKSTFIVLTVVPLGFIGGVTMLLLTGYTLSFTAFIGFIALVGIEVKTSILLVDFTNQLREQGMGLVESIEKAGAVRFVPVLLTSMTAIGGLIPIALERSDLFSPLALVIIGGLISSTLLARLVTPVMYKLLPPKVEVIK